MTTSEAAANYRIVTNGTKWQVERRRRFLWWTWWSPNLSGSDDYETQHDCEQAAQNEMAHAIRRYADARRPWRVAQTGTEFIRGLT